jgi:transposase
MANKPIEMKKLRAVLRLHLRGRGKRVIARSCGLAKNTVKKYVELYACLSLSPEELDKLDDKALSELFTQTQKAQTNQRLKDLLSFFPYMHKELRKTGVTRKLLWEEYKARYPDGYQVTQFCLHYSRWKKRVDPVMHVEYKAGDKMLVDYSGKKMSFVEPQSGEVREAEIFVAILGASQLIYVEASLSQQKADFILSCENTLHFYGGVPRAIVTDNLKSAVTKSHRYEPKLNPDFADFAEHYETAVLPTRAYKPKDKALVEGAVRIVYQQVCARLRDQTFHNLEDLNQAIWAALEKLNRRKLSGRPYSRLEFFREVEADALASLPAERFEIRNYLRATVLQNGHVLLKEDRHYYSVPFKYIRKKVKIAYTSKEVKVYYNYHCIAIHKRLKSPYNYTTDPDHLASQHKQYTKWNAEYFLEWAESIDTDVRSLIQRILERKQHPEQAYRSCIGVLGLKKKVGKERFVRACTLALVCERYSYGAVSDILEKGMDKLQAPEEPAPLPAHDNIRGKTYYSSSKSQDHEQRHID